MADLGYLADPYQVYPIIGGVPRSPQWPKKEKEFKSAHPECSCCLSKNNLQVHHKKPYHTNPELELVDSNLMTVCRYCHFVICHENNWSNVVVDVEHQAKNHLERVNHHRAKILAIYGVDDVLKMETANEFPTEAIKFGLIHAPSISSIA
jgi:hypothetical protein